MPTLTVQSVFVQMCRTHVITLALKRVVSSYKESCNNKPMYGYMLPNLSPRPNLYKVQSVYNNNVAYVGN